MDSTGYGVAATRRGSYDDAAASLRPHLRHLAQRRRSAPSLVFGKALGMPWSPIREEASCWVSVEQSPFVLGLTSENGELLLDECVQVTEGSKTKDRHLFLFSDVIAFAKLKSNSSYRLKHRVSLGDIWLYGFEDDQQDMAATTGDIDLGVTVVLAWALTVCLVCFRSPEVKERWLDTLHRKISEAKARDACASPPPDVLMKVLSGSITTKPLTVGPIMEQVIEVALNGDSVNHQEEKLLLSAETKWSLMKKLRRASSSVKGRRSNTDSKAELFGQPLGKICSDDCSLPKPLAELLVLLRKKGPSTEGVFRKPCNNKNMKDIRAQLNSGLEVDLEAQPVVLLVGLLKSFLKELPGSLLVSELYDKWMAALDLEDTRQRAQEMRKVIDKLPVANKVLLQHLVCVLHHILENADVNKMDSYNLAVCIAPTLLQLNTTPLDEQKDRIEKVTELTQFLIEHSEILGENIPNLLDTDEDSLTSQHHDSAYDSTDPDGEGAESASSLHGQGGSSSSLTPPSCSRSSWPADAIFNTKPVNRRCSEPIILLSPHLKGLCSHARSHDDCSVARRDFEGHPLKKQISDDSFLLRGQGGAGPVLSFPKLNSLNIDQLPYMSSSDAKDCSCSSLESAASNQSEGSAFTSSPGGSPTCNRKANSPNQLPVATKAQQDIARPITGEKRHSQSMRVASKVLMRTRSVGAFSKSSLRRDSLVENSFPCETLQEDSQSEADPPAETLQKPRPLSAIEVFKLVDCRQPSMPPPYEHAVQSTGLPPQYESLTVQGAIELERRSRPSSVNYDFPFMYSGNRSSGCFDRAAQDQADAVKRQQPFRQRAMSESVSAGYCEGVPRRCNKLAFEEFSYAKESYV